jgi:hypothetical protein
LVPHGVPLPSVPFCAQVCAPVVQDVIPVWQGAGVQLAPEVHAMHWPLLQTMLVPHEVPFEALDPVSKHEMPPSSHWMDPTSHGAVGGTQGAPFVHAWHAPLSQYRLTPHAVPFGALPIGVQAGCPVPQVIAEAWQVPASLQSAPAAHGLQPPLKQTPPSQPVPFVTWPWGAQVVVPPSRHSLTPIWQAAGEQMDPGEHVAPVSFGTTTSPTLLSLLASDPPSPELVSDAASPPSPSGIVPSAAPASLPGPDEKSPSRDVQAPVAPKKINAIASSLRRIPLRLR